MVSALRLFFLALVLSVPFPLFCVGGSVFHGKKVSVIKTEYFDILFSDDCAVSARKVAAVADGYYAEIAGRLGTEPRQRFPVVITRQVESPNGFFSPAPYSTIVLYESVLTNPLDSFSGSIEPIFYHELAHAVTLNDKSGFWRGMSFFGDFMSPAYLSASYFWLEGASVLFESTIPSADGEGRLSNPYFTQLVSQAKADARAGRRSFPSWRDVAGSRDIFPGGTTRYAFGACFAQFLVETRGMEPYQEFWRRCGTSTTLSFVAGIFKKTYNTTMDKAWAEFLEWIPDVLGADGPRAVAVVSDGRAAVKALDSSPDGGAGVRRTVWFDSKSSSVMMREGGRTEKLFSATGVSRLSFSPDGGKIAVSRTVSRRTPQAEVGVYDVARRTYDVARKSGAREAFFRDGSLAFLDMGGQIDSELSVHSPLSVRLDSGEEIGACIEKRGFDWRIRVGERAFSIGERRILHNLHLERVARNEVSLCFTWADADGLSSVSKVGRISVNTEDFSATVRLQRRGAFAPFVDVVPADDGGGFFVVAAEYEANPLYAVSFSDDDFETMLLAPPVPEDTSGGAPQEPEDASRAEWTVSPYSPFSYALKGTKLPLGVVPVMDGGFAARGLAFLGASYVTSSPWLNNFILVSGGFDPAHKDGGLLLGLYGFDSAREYRLFGTALFDSGGFMHTYESCALSACIFRGLVSSVQVGMAGDFFFGRELERSVSLFRYDGGEGRYVPRSAKAVREGVFTSSRAYVSLSNAHKVGPGVEEVLGFTFRPFFEATYSSYTIEYDGGRSGKTPKVGKRYFNFGGTAVLRFPGISAGAAGGLFPLTVQATLFPSDEHVLSAQARVTLFSREIQKGIPALSLYAARASVFASYTGFFSYLSDEFFDVRRTFELFGGLSPEDYSDRVTVGAGLALSPNTGALADPSLQFTLGANLNYFPSPEDGAKWSVDVVFGILDFSGKKSFR